MINRISKQGGNSVVEFALILPWFLLSVLAIIYVSIWVVGSQMLHFAAFKGAREMSLYAINGAISSVAAITPKSVILGLDYKQNLHIGRSWFDLLLPMAANAPIQFALEGNEIDLDLQMDRDKYNLYRMDNWIGFCGSKGKYHLCY